MESYRIRRLSDGLYYKGYQCYGMKWGPKGRFYSRNALSQVLSNWSENKFVGSGIKGFTNVVVESYELAFRGESPVSDIYPSKKKVK